MSSARIACFVLGTDVGNLIGKLFVISLASVLPAAGIVFVWLLIEIMNLLRL